MNENFSDGGTFYQEAMPACHNRVALPHEKAGGSKGLRSSQACPLFEKVAGGSKGLRSSQACPLFETLTEFLRKRALKRKCAYRSFTNIFRPKTRRKYYVNMRDGYYTLFINRLTDEIISKEFKSYKN